MKEIYEQPTAVSDTLYAYLKDGEIIDCNIKQDKKEKIPLPNPPLMGLTFFCRWADNEAK